MTKEQAIMYLRSMQGICSPQDRMAKEAVRMATDALSADAVQVVRCKDCKHWHSNTEFCSIWSFQNIAQRTLSDDYCSRAERKEE